MEPFFGNAFKSTIHSFEKLEREFNVEYMVVGGILTPMYADARFTRDIGFVLKIDFIQFDINKMVSFLKGEGFKPFTNWKDTFYQWPSTEFASFISPHGNLKIDLNILLDDPSEDSPFKLLGSITFPRRVRLEIGDDLEFWAESKEDFILSKLVYQGIQDYKDALACFLRNKDDLDVLYLREAGKSLGIEDFLDAILEKKGVKQVFLEDF
ncbi:MAG: hypothetical protein ACTSUE_20240 [Promethearchaeota archaeon]